MRIADTHIACGAIAACLAAFWGSAHPAAAQEVSDRPGWYASIGTRGEVLDLDPSANAGLRAAGVVLDEEGTGGVLRAGYAFGPGFAVEADLSVLKHGSGAGEPDVNVAHLQIEAIAPLVRNARVQPYVAGGVGGSGIDLHDRGVEQISLSAGTVGFGGGIEVHATRHFAFSIDYRHSILAFAATTLRAPTSAPVAFDGEARSHLVGLHATWSF